MAKKKMEVHTFPSGTIDHCPDAAKHTKLKAKARNDDSGRASCPGCLTLWEVLEVEEEDTEGLKRLADEASVADANNSQASFDGNQGVTVGAVDEGANTTENT
jgi:hypothetical protein